MTTDPRNYPRARIHLRAQTDLYEFAAAAGIHPELVRRFVTLGLLSPDTDTAGRMCFGSAAGPWKEPKPPSGRGVRDHRTQRHRARRPGTSMTSKKVSCGLSAALARRGRGRYRRR
ncbi:hypothetical protein [Actinacidiphila oryziradicis]|uniref:MerR family transcriptional regulator n=1 Tax=Actinacidiphila oryziradicis TaxID=2571141 RepID=A0A4U0S7A4_9ACTN|nr:hypothetical protein [Actinacidiphila oryziradicis]TJZ96284.1 hypothetical protein FCI23_51170 [Actinacidiphila oryziradicis]